MKSTITWKAFQNDNTQFKDYSWEQFCKEYPQQVADEKDHKVWAW